MFPFLIFSLNTMKRLLIFLLFVCLTFVFVGAQGLLSIKHYSSRDGLSQNMVQSVLQDADGFIWMATWNDGNVERLGEIRWLFVYEL